MCLIGITLAGCTVPETSPEDALREIGPYLLAASEYNNLVMSGTTSAGDVEGLEDAVAACMSAQGFEYLPIPEEPALSADEASMSEFVDGPFGLSYGLVSSYGETFDAELVPLSAAAAANEAYIASLSESQTDAYWEALDGTIFEELADNPDAAWSWEKAGCRGEAEHLTRTAESPAVPVAGPYDELVSSLVNLPTDVERDDRWTAAISEWSACMSDEGYDFSVLAEASTFVAEAQQRLIEEWSPDLSEAFAVPGTDTYIFDEEVPLRPDEASWEQLMIQEHELAVVDASCREKVDLEGAWDRVYADVTTEFVERNRGDLDGLLIWVREAGS